MATIDPDCSCCPRVQRVGTSRRRAQTELVIAADGQLVELYEDDTRELSLRGWMTRCLETHAGGPTVPVHVLEEALVEVGHREGRRRGGDRDAALAAALAAHGPHAQSPFDPALVADRLCARLRRDRRRRLRRRAMQCAIGVTMAATVLALILSLQNAPHRYDEQSEVFAGLDPGRVSSVLSDPVRMDQIASAAEGERDALAQASVRNAALCQVAANVYSRWIATGRAPRWTPLPRPQTPEGAMAVSIDATEDYVATLLQRPDPSSLAEFLRGNGGCSHEVEVLNPDTGQITTVLALTTTTG